MERLKNYIASLRFDFVKHAPVVSSISALLVLASWVLFFVPGPKWGIDFTGGTEMVLKFDAEISIDELRDALTTLDIPSDAIQEVGGADDNEFKVRIQDPEFGAADLEKSVVEKLTAAFGAEWIESIEFNPEVGASSAFATRATRSASRRCGRRSKGWMVFGSRRGARIARSS